MTNTHTFTTYKLGCLKDIVDINDLMMSKYIIPKKLPKSVNWFDMSIPVLNQGEEPACVGYSSVGMKREHEKIEDDKLLEFSGQDLYDRCKKIDGIPDEEGTFIRVAMKLLQKEGVKGADGTVYKIDSYAKVNTIEELKTSILVNGFAVIGVEVFENFYNPINGVVDYKEGQKSEGGHAILVGAYDDNTEKMPFKNSWGEEWGLGGFGYLTYRYLEKAMHTAWTAVDLENPKLIANSILDIGKIKQDLAKVNSN